MFYLLLFVAFKHIENRALLAVLRLTLRVGLKFPDKFKRFHNFKHESTQNMPPKWKVWIKPCLKSLSIMLHAAFAQMRNFQILAWSYFLMHFVERCNFAIETLQSKEVIMQCFFIKLLYHLKMTLSEYLIFRYLCEFLVEATVQNFRLLFLTKTDLKSFRRIATMK